MFTPIFFVILMFSSFPVMGPNATDGQRDGRARLTLRPIRKTAQ